MIYGIGTDIVEVKRIEKNIKNEKFIDKIYTFNEKIYLESRNYNAQTCAGMFAAKEAVSKSFGTGVRGFEIKDIEILVDELGKPNVNLLNKAKELADQKFIGNINVSISHEKEYAVAFSVAEKII